MCRWLLDPLASMNGFVMKLASRPCCVAISFAYVLYVKLSSPPARPFTAENVSSYWVGPHSWFNVRGRSPRACRWRTISGRAGNRWFVSVVVMSVPPNGGLRVSASSR